MEFKSWDILYKIYFIHAKLCIFYLAGKNLYWYLTFSQLSLKQDKFAKKFLKEINELVHHHISIQYSESVFRNGIEMTEQQ